MLMIQMTGLSGAGKSTLAREVKALLLQNPRPVTVAVLDGDAYRQTLCRDLGFSRKDRCENIRRLGKEAAAIMRDGSVALIAAINPYESARKELQKDYGALTVWINCSLDTLKQRDTKGLYRRAALPEGHQDRVTNLTGVNDPYEPPAHADLVIDTHQMSIRQAAELLSAFILRHLPSQA